MTIAQQTEMINCELDDLLSDKSLIVDRGLHLLKLYCPNDEKLTFEEHSWDFIKNTLDNDFADGYALISKIFGFRRELCEIIASVDKERIDKLKDGFFLSFSLTESSQDRLITLCENLKNKAQMPFNDHLTSEGLDDRYKFWFFYDRLVHQYPKDACELRFGISNRLYDFLTNLDHAEINLLVKVPLTLLHFHLRYSQDLCAMLLVEEHPHILRELKIHKFNEMLSNSSERVNKLLEKVCTENYVKINFKSY